MLLSELIKDIPHTLIGNDTEISAIEYDSRREMKKGAIFCCVVGTFLDGHDYAKAAVDAGAAALLVQRELDVDVPQVLVSDVRTAMAGIAANFFGNPAKKLRIVGVTGTNGKTSTTYMLKSIAEQCGLKVGLIGTIRNMIEDEVLYTQRTTPASVDLQEILKKMLDRSVDLVIMEVSSHSLDQKRVYGIDFEVSAFTNLTQDHLDYHKSFENYFEAKKKLFYMTKHAVINADDANGLAICEGTGCSVTTFGIAVKADITARNIDITTSGVGFDMNTPIDSVRIELNTPGLFSVFNAMTAAGLAMRLGIPFDKIVSGLKSMEYVDGRLEPLPTGGRPFSVYLDFAHTPDAIENILTAVRSFAKGRVVTLFGCGGDRDRSKRPIMGEAAGRFSDLLIVTSDNPRTEDPNAIIASVIEGVKRSGCRYVTIENRREAIKYALHNAKENDCIILAGKGHENYQEINGVKHHFDEKEIVAEIIAAMS